jgi:hypothetical protein
MITIDDMMMMRRRRKRRRRRIRRRKGGAKKLWYQVLHSAYKYHSSPLFLGTIPQTMVSAFVVSPKTYLELKSSSNTLQASSTYA